MRRPQVFRTMRYLSLGIAAGLAILAVERWFRAQEIAAHAMHQGQVVHRLPPTMIGEYRAAASGYAFASAVFFVLALRSNRKHRSKLPDLATDRPE